MSSTKDFRSSIQEAYSTLLADGGFVILPDRKGKFVNKYAMRIGNQTTIIEVESISYGTEAWTKVFKAIDSELDNYGLPINKLLDARAPTLKKKKKSTQLEQIHFDANRLINYASDILEGDFSAIDAIVENDRQLEIERKARAPSKQEKEANVASSEAGHFFRKGDHKKVVEILSPHIDLLSKSQLKRLQISKNKIENT